MLTRRYEKLTDLNVFLIYNLYNTTDAKIIKAGRQDPYKWHCRYKGNESAAESQEDNGCQMNMVSNVLFKIKIKKISCHRAHALLK